MEDMDKMIEAEMQKLVDDLIAMYELKYCMEYCTGFKARKEKKAESAKKLEAISTLMTRVGLSSLDNSKRDCSVCFQQYGVSVGEHDAELPVELPCGHILDKW